MLFVKPLQTPLHLGFREVLVARIDGLEFGPVDGNAGLAEQIELVGTAVQTRGRPRNRLTVVLAEISDRLEVRRQLARQPHQLDIPLTLPLQASTRRNTIEIAVNVYLQKRRRMISWAVLFLAASTPTKAELAKIETFDKDVDRANRIILSHVSHPVRQEKSVLWLRSIAYHKA